MAVSIIDGSAVSCGSGGGGGSPVVSGAPANARYWVGQAHADLTAEMDLGALTTGLVFSTVSGGLATPSTIANGTNGHVLTMVAGAPAWAAASGGGGAPTSAQYLALAADATLTAERVFTPGAGLTGTDGGAGAAYTLNVGAADSTITVNADSIQVGADSLTNAHVNSAAAIAHTKLADLAARSVLGRASGTLGAMAAITAGSGSGLALVEQSGSLTFGQVTVFGIADMAVTDAKISNRNARSVFGRSANSIGAGADIVASNDGHILRMSASTLEFGTLRAGSVAGTQTNGHVVQLVAGVPTWTAPSGGVTDHGALTGLTDDDHSQYLLLAGRSGGQTAIGGTAASNNLLLQSTSHATRGVVGIVDNAEVTRSASGAAVSLTVYNTSNTASSHSDVILQPGGTSGGRVSMRFLGGASEWAIYRNASSATMVLCHDITNTRDRILVTSTQIGFSNSPSCHYHFHRPTGGGNSTNFEIDTDQSNGMSELLIRNTSASESLWLIAHGATDGTSRFGSSNAGFSEVSSSTAGLKVGTRGALDVIFGTNDVLRMRLYGVSAGGSGVGTLFLANSTTASSSAPTGGGYLEAIAGALYWRGSSNTLTLIAPA